MCSSMYLGSSQSDVFSLFTFHRFGRQFKAQEWERFHSVSCEFESIHRESQTCKYSFKNTLY